MRPRGDGGINNKPFVSSIRRRFLKLRSLEVSKFAAWACLTLIVGGTILLFASPASAADGTRLFDDKGAKSFAGSIGAGLVLMGGGAAIGRIGSAAVESMARQPEVAGTINTAMLITAAMVEGATLFGVVVCLLGVLNG